MKDEAGVGSVDILFANTVHVYDANIRGFILSPVMSWSVMKWSRCEVISQERVKCGKNFVLLGQGQVFLPLISLNL